MTVDVRGENLHRDAAFQFLHVLGEEDGQRVGFLAGRAADDPEAQWRARRTVLEEGGDDFFLQRGEGIRIAEEAGDIDEQVAEEGVDFVGGLVEVGDVGFEAIDLVESHAALDAAADGGGFVEREVVAGLRAEEDEDFFERALRFGRGNVLEMGTIGEMRGVGDQLGRHFRRGHDVIGEPGGDGAARHAVELGRLRVLGDDQAVFALDGAHAEGAVGAGAGENNADGAFALVLARERKKKSMGRRCPRAAEGLRSWSEPLSKAMSYPGGMM